KEAEDGKESVILREISDVGQVLFVKSGDHNGPVTEKIIRYAIAEGKNIRTIEEVKKHADWVDEWRGQYTVTPDNITEILRKEVAKRFVQVLECAGVYQCTEEGRKAFGRFLSIL
ncbi:MAG: hypothetical protein IJ006_02240, partial [Lachnospiraceae bacterium]|nr:hypothetical protein [Lachnospiraceae bacterium]